MSTFSTRKASAALAMAAAASLALPVGASSVAGGLILVWALLGGGLADKLARIRATPAALAVLLALALCLVGVFHTQADSVAAWNQFGKYAKLVCIPAIVALAFDAADRRRAVDAFLLGALAGVALSWMRLAGVLAPYAPGQPYAAFHDRIGFGIITAFAAYVMAARAWRPGPGWTRAGWAAGAAVAGVDVLMVNNGRTGWVVLFALLFLLAWQRLGRRGLGYAVAGTLAVSLLAFAASDVTRARVAETTANLADYAAGLDHTSVGERLDFARSAWAVFARHPWVGTGTGSLVVDERRLAPDMKGPPTANPHNDLLLIAAQYGTVGLAALALLYATVWRAAAGIDDERRDILHGLVVTMLTAGLFNSALLDAPSGRLFAVLAGLMLARA